MRLDREPAFPKCCDFRVSRGSGDRLDTEGFPGTLGNAAAWPCSPGAGGEEPETIGSLPRAAHAGANSIFPLVDLLSIHSALGEEEREKSLHGVWVAAAWSHPGLLPRQGWIPGRKGLIPSQPWNAAGRRSLEDAVGV